MAIKRSDLVNAAKEMNELMGLDPAIDIKGKPDAIVEGLIKAKELLTPEDVISDSTKVVLEALEEEDAPAPKPVKKNGKKSKPEPEPVEEEEEEEEEPELGEDEEEPVEEESKEEESATVDLKKVLQETRKLDDLKTLVMQNDEFKSLRKGIEAYVGLAGPRELKGQMLRILGVSTEKKEVVPKEKKEKKENQGPSNKLQVYRAWKAGETSIPTLHSLVDEKVKLVTIKSWISAWRRDQNLPAGC